MAKEKILIVDDEPVVRAFVEKVLGRAGHKASSVPDALSAIEAMRKTGYSVAICDIRMPGKDGIWLLKEIKKKYPDTQIIMLTASDNLDDAIASLNFGAENYLLKPLNIEEFSHVVEKALERRRLIIRDRGHKIWMEKKLKEQKRRIREIFIGSIEALITSLEAKDEYTKGHSERVVELSTTLAESIGLNRKFPGKVKIAASLHDIGKIGVREAVLNKPSKLTKEEYEHIKKHPVLSEQIAKPIIEDKDITLSIRHHHERYDGKGYPDGLKEGKIPLGGRIIALTDAYDAMTSKRPYRESYTKEEAMEKIEENAGRQFDPELAKEFLKLIRRLGGEIGKKPFEEVVNEKGR